MIRTVLATTASVVALALAAPAAAHPATAHEGHATGETEQLVQQGDDSQGATETPTMDFGEWGVGLDVLDPNVDPGDDFNAYTNGMWIAQNEIPADRQRFGAFDMLREKSVADVQALVRDLVASNPAPGTAERRIVLSLIHI